MNAWTATTAPLQKAEMNCPTLLAIADGLRARHFASAPLQRQKELGQFLTRPHVADLMAKMFRLRSSRIRLLDAGSGMGVLSAAFVRRQLQKRVPPKRIEVTAYELDQALARGSEETYEACRRACHRRGVEFSARIHRADFIAEASQVLRHDLFSKAPEVFDAAIVNPPYGKLPTSTASYRQLRTVGAETTNLYTAFLNLIVGLLRPQGELVAITPRSFCNGLYFRSFRRRLFKEMSLQRIHVFESRTAAFRHDRVLQETVILHAVKDGRQPPTLVISQSSGHVRGTVRSHTFPTTEIVSPADAEAFIHMPTSDQHLAARNQVHRMEATLETLGLAVSTGRVVDFRAREQLRRMPEADTCPLIYPCHFDGLFVHWPSERCRKPNAIQDIHQTQNLLVPAAVYVLIKRFSSKEERRRVVACIYDPSRIGARRIGLENHLNYIHACGAGLDMVLAKGLWAYLNSSVLDLYFRQFNGHTQVNATDLRNVRFPSTRQLRVMGSQIPDDGMEQSCLDHVVSGGLNA